MGNYKKQETRAGLCETYLGLLTGTIGWEIEALSSGVGWY